MRETVTTVLDVLGLLLIAAGLSWYLWQWIGPLAVIVGGVLLMTGSWLAHSQGGRG